LKAAKNLNTSTNIALLVVALIAVVAKTKDSYRSLKLLKRTA